MRNSILLCSALLLATPIAYGDAQLQTAIVISLADTAAQKAKAQTEKEQTSSPETTIKSAAADGFFKRNMRRLFTRSESASEQPSEVSTDFEKDAAPDKRQKQRDSVSGRKKISNTFDDHFRKYSKHYFGINTDWRWFQAQAMVESEMKPMTRSHAGAMGLMQIMPRTFQEIRSRNPHLNDPFDPGFSIAAGIYYNRQLYDAWSGIDNANDRRRFMFASYNAGLGNVQRAAKRAGNPDSYSVLEPELSAGPRHYLVKIERERKKLSD